MTEMGDPGTRRDAGPGQPDAFDRQAARYDAWYDSPSGVAILQEEMDAVRPLLAGLSHPWLEVGVGSGRFASALGAEYGVDPAMGALALAAPRGVRVAAARAEALPFSDATFGAVLFVAALCFIADPLAALVEARRVLAPGGRLLLGLILAEGPWGRRYQELAQAGDPFYRRAHFFAREELASVLATAGLRVVRTRSALFGSPDAEAVPAAAREGYDPAAGFTAMALEAPSKAQSYPPAAEGVQQPGGHEDDPHTREGGDGSRPLRGRVVASNTQRLRVQGDEGKKETPRRHGQELGDDGRRQIALPLLR